MAQYATEALIIGIKNWGEADKLITLLSPEKGRIKAVAFGCRRPKSALAGSLQMFNQIEVQLREGDKLDTIRSASLMRSFRVMSEDFTAMAYGAFVAELASRLAIENFPQQELYERLIEIFGAFGSRNPRVAALMAAYQILEFSGMQMNYRYCMQCNEEIAGDALFSYEAGGVVCRECADKYAQEMNHTPKAKRGQAWNFLPYEAATREFILQLLELDWVSKPNFTVKGQTLVAAESLLLGYLRHIFDKPMKSLEFIRQIG